MYVWLNLKTIKFCLIKFATDFYWQPRYLLSESASVTLFSTELAIQSTMRVDGSRVECQHGNKKISKKTN